MYVLVEHFVTDPAGFWADVRYALPSMPRYMTLHHCFPTADGTHAVCVWEAERLEDVRGYVESYLGHLSRNVYFEIENRESVAVPSGVRIPEMPGLVAPGEG